MSALGTSGRLPPLTAALAAPLLFGADRPAAACAITNAYEALDRYLRPRARRSAVRPRAARTAAAQRRQGERGRAGDLLGPGARPGRLARAPQSMPTPRRSARGCAGRWPRRALVALDGATVIDPRLIGFLLRSAAAGAWRRAARAPSARSRCASTPARPMRFPPTPPTCARSPMRCVAAGRIAPLDEQAFPAYIDKLRRSLPYWLHVRRRRGDAQRWSGRCSGTTTRARPTC